MIITISNMFQKGSKINYGDLSSWFLNKLNSKTILGWLKYVNICKVFLQNSDFLETVKLKLQNKLFI